MPRPASPRVVPLTLLVAQLLLGPVPASAQAVSDCRPAHEDASAWLTRGRASAGLTPDRAPLGLRVADMVSQHFQSDRMYPPYLYRAEQRVLWLFPASGLEYSSGEALTLFGSYKLPPAWSSDRGTWLVRDSVAQPAPPFHRFTRRARPLDAWAVLLDWSAGPAPRAIARCVVRDFPRVRLERTVAGRPERLYLDIKTGLPVQFERDAVDNTGVWGRQHITFIYTNWVAVGTGQFPMSSYRLVDGELDIIRTAAWDTTATVPTVPAEVVDTVTMATATPAFPGPDTVRVGPAAWMLHSRAYSNVITLARDTVFILDAQWTGEDRARQDSTWIARLFPGRHPVVLVVTDLAWPHIAGVRSWVAMGARVVAHRSAIPFLTKVVQHRWPDPDLLERRRGSVRVRFQPVDDSLSLGGGAVRIYAINGIGSEGALMAWLPGDRFLYASDYVQGLGGPSLQYAREIRDATARVGIAPERLGAMHLPVTPWPALTAVLDSAATGGTGAAAGAP